MDSSRPGLFKSLWQQFRWDDCEDAEDIGESNDPIEIFGLFRKSKKRRFTRDLVVIDIRPFELWDRHMEKGFDSRLEWFHRENMQVSIVFECRDGQRIMGLVPSNLFNSKKPRMQLGERYRVTGSFNYIKPLLEQGILLFFRIIDWS